MIQPEQQLIKIELTKEQINVIMQHLVKGIYSNVNSTIGTINKQYKEQTEIKE